MPQISLNNHHSLPEKDYFNKFLIKLAIIIFILLSVFLLALYLIQKNLKLTEENKNLNQSPKVLAAILPREATVVYHRSGMITNIQSSYITIRSQIRTTSPNPLQAYETKTLTVYIDDNTVYTKRNYQNFNQTKVVPPAEPSNKSELRVNDFVNVKSNTNIKGLTSFTAIAIEKVVQ